MVCVCVWGGGGGVKRVYVFGPIMQFLFSLEV